MERQRVGLRETDGERGLDTQKSIEERGDILICSHLADTFLQGNSHQNNQCLASTLE